MNVRKATQICFERYLNQNKFNLTPDLIVLAQKAILEINNYPIDKLSRWLGFIQGYVIFTKQTTIKNERDFSRELFHNAYKNENIKIPKSFSSEEDKLTKIKVKKC